MNILIVSATEPEVALALQKLEHNKKISEYLTFARTANEHNIYFLYTGVGMIATTYHLTNTLQNHQFDCIINAGIAGGIRHAQIGEVVNVVDDLFFELGAEDNDIFIPIQSMNLLQEKDFPLNAKNITFKNNFGDNEIIKRLNVAHGITVNKVHGNVNSIKAMHKRLLQNNALCFTESMEGAAVAYVAAKQNIAAIQLRGVSNMVEPRNRNNWNIPLALQNLNEVLFEFLTSL